MIESFQNKRALLVGNGVNLLDSTQSLSWGALLQTLKDTYGIDIDLDNVFKPFPLAFDEILHQKSGLNDFEDKIKNLKQTISRKFIRHLEHKEGYNIYHRKLASLPYNDILTTNYDYSLEKSIIPDFLKFKNQLAINKYESKHSLRRGYFIDGKTIWHLHGELYDSRKLSETSEFYKEESIMIGYEHYTSYLELIQENINGKNGSQKIDNQSLMVRLRNGKPSPFWTDILFTHNVDIIGQGFDFSENHLWWLINYRAIKIRDAKSKKEVEINNKIRFFYPLINGLDQISFDELNNLNKLIEKKNNIQKSKAIAEVLKAFEVEPRPIQAESYMDFYDKLILYKLFDPD